MTRKPLEDFIAYCKEHGIEVTYDVNSENIDTFETFFGDMIEQLESNSLSVKFDEYCKKHKDTCDDDCDVGKCMREFCYQQGRADAIDEYNDAIKSHLRKLSTKFVSDKDFDFIAEQLKGEKAHEEFNRCNQQAKDRCRMS